MIPTTFAGMVLFLAFLTPGFVFLQRRELRHPRRHYSALRETGIVVSSSALVNATAAGVVGLLSREFDVPSASRTIRDGSDYIADRLWGFVTWSTILLLIACALAYLLAAPPRIPWSWCKHWRFVVWCNRQAGVAQNAESAWTAAFYSDCPDNASCHVGAVLQDGTFVAGELVRFSADIDEGPRRSITLGGALMYRAAGESETSDVDAQRIVLAAEQIAELLVYYVDSTSSSGS